MRELIAQSRDHHYRVEAESSGQALPQHQGEDSENRIDERQANQDADVEVIDSDDSLMNAIEQELERSRVLDELDQQAPVTPRCSHFDEKDEALSLCADLLGIALQELRLCRLTLLPVPSHTSRANTMCHASV